MRLRRSEAIRTGVIDESEHDICFSGKRRMKSRIARALLALSRREFGGCIRAGNGTASKEEKVLAEDITNCMQKFLILWDNKEESCFCSFPLYVYRMYKRYLSAFGGRI